MTKNPMDQHNDFSDFFQSLRKALYEEEDAETKKGAAQPQEQVNLSSGDEDEPVVDLVRPVEASPREEQSLEKQIASAQASSQEIHDFFSAQAYDFTRASLHSLKETLKQEKKHLSALDSHKPVEKAITLEQVVIKAITPLLKAWIHTHLAELMERAIQKEIEKISRDI